MDLLPGSDYSGWWEYTHDWQMPLRPVKSLHCPVCGGPVRLKEYYPHTRQYKVAGKQFRIDVWIKCCACAHVWAHGVSVPEAYYREIVSEMEKRLGSVRPLHVLEAIDIEQGEKTHVS